MVVITLASKMATTATRLSEFGDKFISAIRFVGHGVNLGGGVEIAGLT